MLEGFRDRREPRINGVLMDRYFGCHVSASGGLSAALSRGEELGVNTIQIHPSPPQRWNRKPFADGVERELLAKRESSVVKKIFFHGIYLINLANPNPEQADLSRHSLLHDLELSSRIKGDGVIFHVGSLKDEPDETVGFSRAAESVNWVLERAPTDAMLLLEVAAGSGAVIGDRFEELATIYEMVERKEQCGFALDTQHMWASGYNLRDELDQIVSTIDSLVGIDKVKAIHLNDSKSALGSRVDRHENLGEGTIGNETLHRVIHHPKLRTIPFILETPGLKDMEGAKSEVEKLRAIVASE